MVTHQPNEYAWEDLRIGLTHEFKTCVSEEMMARFCTDTGDVNPLHLDEQYAIAQGFKGRVVYGMLVASFYSTLAGVHLPGRYCLLHGVQTSFVEPVFIGEQLTVSGEITYLNEAYRQIQMGARITRDDGTVVSKAKLSAGVLTPRSKA